MSAQAIGIHVTVSYTASVFVNVSFLWEGYIQGIRKNEWVQLDHIHSSFRNNYSKITYQTIHFDCLSLTPNFPSIYSSTYILWYK